MLMLVFFMLGAGLQAAGMWTLLETVRNRRRRNELATIAEQTASELQFEQVGSRVRVVGDAVGQPLPGHDGILATQTAAVGRRWTPSSRRGEQVAASSPLCVRPFWLHDGQAQAHVLPGRSSRLVATTMSYASSSRRGRLRRTEQRVDASVGNSISVGDRVRVLGTLQQGPSGPRIGGDVLLSNSDVEQQRQGLLIRMMTTGTVAGVWVAGLILIAAGGVSVTLAANTALAAAGVAVKHRFGSDGVTVIGEHP